MHDIRLRVSIPTGTAPDALAVAGLLNDAIRARGDVDGIVVHEVNVEEMDA